MLCKLDQARLRRLNQELRQRYSDVGRSTLPSAQALYEYFLAFQFPQKVGRPSAAVACELRRAVPRRKEAGGDPLRLSLARRSLGRLASLAAQLVVRPWLSLRRFIFHRRIVREVDARLFRLVTVHDRGQELVVHGIDDFEHHLEL